MEVMEILKLKLLNKPFTIIVYDDKQKLNYEYTFSFDEYNMHKVHGATSYILQVCPLSDRKYIANNLSDYIFSTPILLEIGDNILQTTIDILIEEPDYVYEVRKTGTYHKGDFRSIKIRKYRKNILNYYHKLKAFAKIGVK